MYVYTHIYVYVENFDPPHPSSILSYPSLVSSPTDPLRQSHYYYYYSIIILDLGSTSGQVHVIFGFLSLAYLTHMISSSIHFPTNDIISFSFMAKQNSLLCVYIYIYIIFSKILYA
jgi:hypothetical protein